jgi:predicted O-methyltransferase YrrM
VSRPTPGRDWQAWHQEYDDPASSLSRRLADVRAQLARLLEDGVGPLRLLSLCSGDGRDTIPVLAGCDREVEACLVELDPELAERARRAADEAGVELEVRTADAGALATFADRLSVDILMLCGVFGNISDADVERCVDASRALVRPGGAVVWTRGSRVPDDPTDRRGDPAEWIRRLFRQAGYEEVAFIAPADASYRVGVVRQPSVADVELPDRLFSFVR